MPDSSQGGKEFIVMAGFPFGCNLTWTGGRRKVGDLVKQSLPRVLEGVGSFSGNVKAPAVTQSDRAMLSKVLAVMNIGKDSAVFSDFWRMSKANGYIPRDGR